MYLSDCNYFKIRLEVTSAKLSIVKYYLLYCNRYELVITSLLVKKLLQAMAYAGVSISVMNMHIILAYFQFLYCVIFIFIRTFLTKLGLCLGWYGLLFPRRSSILLQSGRDRVATAAETVTA